MSNQSKISESIHHAYFTSEIDALFSVSVLKKLGWLGKGSSILECAAGDGSLIKALSEEDVQITAIDLIDYGIDAEICNYLDRPTQRHDLVFTNPPFGKMASLATAFFNKAAKDSDRIAFIVPQSFRKISIIDRLDRSFWPIIDLDLPEQSYTLPDGSRRVVKSCFQCWSSQKLETRPKLKSIDHSIFFKAVTKDKARSESGAFAIRGQGSKAGKVLEGLDHNEATTRFLVGFRDEIESLDLSVLAGFTAGIPSIGFAEIAHALQCKTLSDRESYLKHGATFLLGALHSQL